MKGLVHARLIKRYKRFLADVRLDNDEMITVHCPNTGSMKNCVEENAEIWLSDSNNPKRKYRYTWEYLRTSRGHHIGVNAGKANQLVQSAIRDDLVEPLAGYDTIRPEVKYGDENSRIDLLLQDSKKQDCYVEVKSVTLLEDPPSSGIGYFPDAVSERGAKHLRELIKMSQSDARSVLFFCVQHTGIQEVRPADHIDREYGKLLREALDSGVEVLAYKVRKSNKGFRLWRDLPVIV
jgi:sugar fermentation stimulation protein A|tara:strand:- start:1010 stop:1717 length:708 start_codon:yes stop_codon:yes gene_type:complete